MTDEEAEEMMARLAEHFHEPVRPVSTYCKAFLDYAHAVRENFRDNPDGHPLTMHVNSIHNVIAKSNLLARLLYGGEKLRTRKCPDHKGVWSGVPMGPENDCSRGCDLTGWIREPEDGGPEHGSEPETWQQITRWD